MRPYDFVKRTIDATVGSLALLASLPMQAVIGLLIKRRLGSPVLFRQERPGKDGEIFELVKFRTMLDVDEEAGRVSDAQRMTPLGSLLRATSLDELPTLWNVIKGDMSLVGPRPLLVRYLDRYTPEQARRHEVRPGITGLAQVSGRNAISWDDKFAKDVEYVDDRSLLLDLRIVLMTIAKVVKRDGIAADGDVTMPEFMGNSHA
ncbi:sugar transferase [Nocardioides massiliensis]|uniref:Lipopolysaccharide/colanic/teichoic acid biosynthesis glycosyltransferase n=1 Tax=Nocardioides massiliensis TaxID=1325935 RepID=A0ABT9NNG6_9ACTN|nr:sugar transferase [Nocardioides massiliensis]MDP9821792.1 lipopolysaccharide/colanic/teichoic acid biosynthesis glycosyltransferase [Nocardioides massiliensis]